MSPSARAALGLLAFPLLAALPVNATAGFQYRWHSSRVTVEWTEGNDGPEAPALRRQIGHWKRLAHTLWTRAPHAPPLRMQVSLWGPEMGSDGPRVRLDAGGRWAQVQGAVTEEALYRALLSVRGGPSPAAPPADDTDARISPDGQWVSCVSWRGGAGPEVWIARRDLKVLMRIAPPGGSDIADRLLLTVPRWARDGRHLAWVQGGRLVLVDVTRKAARLATPAGPRVVDFAWSPHPTPTIVVRYDDDRFQLLDTLTGNAIPVSDLLPDAAPIGPFFWSPSGRRLLFPTQGRIVTAGLAVPGPPPGGSPLGGAGRGWRQFVERLLGPGDPPRRETGPNEERLSVLDLGARRLDGFPVRGSPLDGAEVRSVNWSPREDVLFLVAGDPGSAHSRLVRLPLHRGARPETLRTAGGSLIAVGVRTREGGSAAEQLDPAAAQYAFVGGGEVVLLRDAGPGGTPEFTKPYPPSEFLHLILAPGPQGGYQGVAGEMETEDEPPRRVLLESFVHTGRAAIKREIPSGFLASTVLESGVIAPLRAMVRHGDIVDLDLHQETDQLLAVVVTSSGGGVGQMVTLVPEARDPLRARHEPLSFRMSETASLIIRPAEREFPLVDSQTGVSALAARYEKFNRKRLVLLVGGLALLGVVLVLFRRRLRRA